MSRAGPCDNGDRRTGRRSDMTEYRNKRMFASIQSALGANPGAPTPSRQNNRPPRGRDEDDVQAEKLKSVDDIIFQLADLSIRGERSAAQIKRNIQCNPSVLSEMWDEEWTKLVAVLIKAALNEDEAPFVVDILPVLMKYGDFVEQFRDELIRVATGHVMLQDKKESDVVKEGDEEEEEEKKESFHGVPALLGSLLCAQWPRGMHRDTEESNPVLFTAMQIVRGWIMVVEGEDEEEDERREKERIKKSGRKAFQVEDEEEDTVAATTPKENGTEGQEEKEELNEEELLEKEHDRINLLNRCAYALSSVCHSQQRSLWFRQPELVDQMYKCIKPAITHNNHVTGEIKASLLHMLIMMHDWTKTRSANTKCSSTQTAKQ